MPEQDSRVAELVSEFVALNRRRVQTDPPLSVLEKERWAELRDLLAWEFGHAPPIGGAQPRALRVPVELKISFGNPPEIAMVENLSEGGAFVRFQEPPALGSLLPLEIEGEGEPKLRLEGLVAHRREYDNLDGPAGFGLTFQDLLEEDLEILTRLLEAALSRAAGR